MYYISVDQKNKTILQLTSHSHLLIFNFFFFVVEHKIYNYLLQHK